ncbi:hypothetical protein HMPREF1544_03453 [Mucor circinelloides 1006PhL]|uniref:Uncharacterized protein n=1 Tax=Mucor circinelloides f. circinelloides (strain 1006PhL) TaxID=1220926 RepID=S2KBG6_MUCC1|nr:hypothetical protein HMPREF1544_03453 [Mucor circinelloides 1006PhL]
MPYIQWRGHKFNNKKFIFPIMDACFQQFQDVLESRAINPETNWKRIIKSKMSTGKAAWTRELISKYPAISWGQFKSKVKTKCDSLESFINKFNTLKDLAGVKENTALVDYLLRSLDIDLYTPVSMSISRSCAKGSDTLDFAISQLRSKLNAKIKEALRAAYRKAEDGSSFKDARSKQTRRAGRYHDKTLRNKKPSDNGEIKKKSKSIIPRPAVHRNDDDESD